MEQFSIKNLGPISEATVDFGDLTFLVGPQATGKSLFLETLKLVSDGGHIVRTLDTYSYAIGRAENILNAYYGDGMSKLWREDTSATYEGRTYSGTSWLLEKDHEPSPKESLLYIPAQRILSISDGRPKNFMEFDGPTPYILRYFSERLRGLLTPMRVSREFEIKFEIDMKSNTSIGSTSADILTKEFDASIFSGAKITWESDAYGQRKLFLRIDDVKIPFMSWSAGQKEYLPLMLAITYLFLSKNPYKYIIIEEPEMGLHPRAINAIILQLLALTQAGYRIIVSTHSPMFLEFAWAFNFLKSLKTAHFNEALAEILSMNEREKRMTNEVSKKTIKTYFFQRKQDGRVTSRDISSLDVDDDDTIVSEWGGLSSFASKASEVVSKYAPDDE